MRKTTLTIALIALAGAAHAETPVAPETLAKSRNCLACHSDDRKIVGPSFKDVAAKYKGDSKAAEKLARSSIEGSKGSWGTVPMPANKGVSEEEARVLAEWILSKK